MALITDTNTKIRFLIKFTRFYVNFCCVVRFVELIVTVMNKVNKQQHPPKQQQTALLHSTITCISDLIIEWHSRAISDHHLLRLLPVIAIALLGPFRLIWWMCWSVVIASVHPQILISPCPVTPHHQAS